MNQNFTPIQNLIDEYKKKAMPVSHSKEGEPVMKKSTELSSIQEAVEHQPPSDVAPFITVKHETIHLPPDLSSIGLKTVSTTTFPNYQDVKLPMSDDSVLTGLHAPITSSVRWLATFAMYLLLRAHLTLRIVHGKTVRVMKR